MNIYKILNYRFITRLFIQKFFRQSILQVDCPTWT